MQGAKAPEGAGIPGCVRAPQGLCQLFDNGSGFLTAGPGVEILGAPNKLGIQFISADDPNTCVNFGLKPLLERIAKAHGLAARVRYGCDTAEALAPLDARSRHPPL
jgi:hypothetical protein